MNFTCDTCGAPAKWVACDLESPFPAWEFGCEALDHGSTGIHYIGDTVEDALLWDLLEVLTNPRYRRVAPGVLPEFLRALP